ncbi:MAG: cytochrome ubiquinol oxidase subunit I, partial [Archaeoglobaceae archaeon]
MALLWKHNRTGVEDYFRDAKIATSVLAVNFALGAITGTLVEFGLVQAWPGTIVAIATFAFTPLAFELVAFACEIALLVLFIVTLGKIKPMKRFPNSCILLDFCSSFRCFDYRSELLANRPVGH